MWLNMFETISTNYCLGSKQNDGAHKTRHHDLLTPERQISHHSRRMQNSANRQLDLGSRNNYDRVTEDLQASRTKLTRSNSMDQLNAFN